MVTSGDSAVIGVGVRGCSWGLGARETRVAKIPVGMAMTSQRFRQENRVRFSFTGRRFVVPPLTLRLGRLGLLWVAGGAFRAKERCRASHLPIHLKVPAQLTSRQPPSSIIQQKPVLTLGSRAIASA